MVYSCAVLLWSARCGVPATGRGCTCLYMQRWTCRWYCYMFFFSPRANWVYGVSGDGYWSSGSRCALDTSSRGRASLCDGGRGGSGGKLWGRRSENGPRCAHHVVETLVAPVVVGTRPGHVHPVVVCGLLEVLHDHCVLLCLQSVEELLCAVAL